MDRRAFLKIAAMGSLSFAAGCSSQPDRTLYSLVQAPEDRVTGRETWYASTCRECPAGCGILAKNREGRAVKLEGNPLHPINRGKLCMRGQAALQGVYDPDRLTRPLVRENGRFKAVSHEKALAILREKGRKAADRGPDRVVMLTEMIGPVLFDLSKDLLGRWRSDPPVIFELFAYESLKLAHAQVVGIPGLPSYRMEAADLLVSFGADFLETWLSPVEYSRRFKQMHASGSGEKGVYLHVGPYGSLTAANADRFLSCRCGGEAFVALGLLREILEKRPWAPLQSDTAEPLNRILAPFNREGILKASGIAPEAYALLLQKLLSARKPLILGTPGTCSGENGPATDAAVALLNTVLNPDLGLMDFRHRHTVERAAKRSDILEHMRRLYGGETDLLILNSVDPVHAIPAGAGMNTVFGQDALFVVSFSAFMTETAALSDLIIPLAHPLEAWDAYEGKTGLWSLQQPVMGNLTGAPSFGDLLLGLSGKSPPGEGPPASGVRTETYHAYLIRKLSEKGMIGDAKDWVTAVQNGGMFEGTDTAAAAVPSVQPSWSWAGTLGSAADPTVSGTVFAAIPSVRLFDGRGANKSWLNETPEPLTQVAWQTPVLMHSDTASKNRIRQGDIVKITSAWGSLEAPVYWSDSQHPDLLLMALGQGHSAYGRHAKGFGVNGCAVLSPDTHPICGGPLYRAAPVSFAATGRAQKPAAADGSRFQHGRKIARTVSLKALQEPHREAHHGLGLGAFPLTLPLPEGYDPRRDIYPSHDHDGYRWAMGIDLDRCIGCGACVVACYAENNIGVVGEARILEGREMAWLRIERYHDEADPTRVIFLPMLCQHCDNAPVNPSARCMPRIIQRRD